MLIETYEGIEPGSTRVDAQSHNELGYLLNRGELEALAGDYELSIEFFEKAQTLQTNIQT